jgi:hypothetical protein
MKVFKPLNLLNDKGFWPEKVAIADAIKEVLTIGKCRRPMAVHDFGHYRDRGWRNEKNELVPYQSVDWYVYDALNEDRMQVDGDKLLHTFATSPWRNEAKMGDHYDLFIMEEDMFDPSGTPEHLDLGYAVGKSERLTAAIISTHRIEHIWGLPYSYLKTEIMRQMCFMFEVPKEERADVVIEGDEVFCRNVCILRPASLAPEDWDRLTEDRIRYGPLCDSCTADLQRFFQRAAAEAR